LMRRFPSTTVLTLQVALLLYRKLPLLFSVLFNY
jgi:hypothetical protein